ncbi:hypothetical protein [uncultured Arcticibacterium sp.]|uniref:hypothetical protein n=1 Tax=uncultured Arcticibacterium sp. TaxID=2173042 RepID=UPI0030F73D7A
MRYFIYLLIYFQLQKVHLTIDWIEKGIIIGAILYMSAFTLQYILFPFKILDYGSITEMERGLLRFRIEGAGFLMLATFLALNRFIEKRSIKFLIFYTIGMVFLFMLGFRTLLVAGIISSFYLIIKLSKKPSLIVRNTIISIALSSPLLLVDEVNSYITEMTEISEKQINSGDDYIRKRTFKFYMEKVNIDEISLLFGNGFPQENSKYGKITHSGSKLYGYIFADLGIVGFAIIYGLIATLFFLLILIKAIRIKTDREYYYLSAYFLYIFIACFTTAELYRAGIFGIQALGLFLISRTKIS